jgi:flagellar basal body-associated protein FliL
MIRAPSRAMSEAAAEKTDAKPAAGGGGNKKILIIVMVVNVLLVGGLAYVVISSRNQAAAAAAAALKQAHPAKHGDGEEGEGEGEAAEGEAKEGGKEAPEEEGEKKDAKHGKFGPLLEIGTFVANLQTAPGEQVRYAKVTLHAEALNEEAKTRIESALVPIKSEALMMLSNARPEDIVGQEKIQKLADDMVKRANKLLGKKSIKQVYFAELVVQ